MKNIQIIITLMLFSLGLNAQNWNSTGNNTTSGDIILKNPHNTDAVSILSWQNDIARIRIGGMGTGSSNGFMFQGVADVNLLRILGNGNLGVGTDSPKSKLHLSNGVSGGNTHGFSDLTIEDDDHVMVSLLTPADKNGYYGFSDANDDFLGGMQYEHTTNTLRFRTNNHESDMAIRSNGYIGVGLQTPQTKLHVSNGVSGGATHSFSDLTIEDDDHVMISLLTPADKNGYYGFSDTNDEFLGGMQYEHATNTPRFRTNNHESDMVIKSNGNVGIGTIQPDSKLTVKGKIHTQEVKVDLAGAVAPDYVFLEDYNLKTIEEVAQHILEKGHLPNIPSAKEMEKEGINLKEMNLKLLEKIEELTLYTIAQEEELEKQEGKIKKLESQSIKIEALEEKLERLLKDK